MRFYLDLEKRKELIRQYLKKNSNSTFKEIKNVLHTKINKVYARGMEEAYEDAGVPKPRTLRFKTKEEKKKILIEYLRKNPNAGGHIIKRDTKINFLTLFKNTEEMFECAGVPYERHDNRLLKRRSSDERKKIISDVIKKNPHAGIREIMRLSGVNIYHNFSSIKSLYKEAKVKYLGKGAKRKAAKQKQVVEFIKNNNFATQREINNACKTHVQLLFVNGIFDAYTEAGVAFPYERLKLHGAAIARIKNEADKFEAEIAGKLSGYGAVNRTVRTRRGFADIIFERKGKKVAIELKNYKSHEISISQIKQLNKYVEDINSTLGFLICLKKPKRDTFLIGRNKIFVVTESELSKIPEIIDSGP